ncbi:MAG: hypothetical protein M1830_008599 [Pleopsidium flavum]|nr:MAG: hypothetical protein M1830_008599 [Pleopsidium flavum]
MYEPLTSAEAEDGSDWEYEYHETETESFYVTLDLTSTIGLIRPKKKAKSQTTTVSAPAIPATPAQPVQSADGTPDPSQTNPTSQSNRKSAEPSAEEDDETLEDSRIQILDLHTPNPIISYRNHIYDCHWASTIGTDLLITAPNPESDLPKLKEGHGYDILAASSIKIIGQSAQLVPRADVRVVRNTASDNIADEEVDQSGVKIPVGPAATKARQNQARFLERLIKAKHAKGEQDSVTVHSQKRMTNSGWRAQQNQRRAEEEAEREDLRRLAAEGDDTARRTLEEMETQPIEEEASDEVKATLTSTGRGRGRGRGRGKAAVGRSTGRRSRAPGGLFRDDRPVEGDEEGANIRRTLATSPQTLDVLEAMSPSNPNAATLGTSEATDRPDSAMPDTAS